MLFGHELMLSGQLSSGTRGAAVAIYSRPYGRPSLSKLRSVVTEAGGGWSLRVEPTILTTYQARAGRVVTLPLSVGVEPAIAVRRLVSGAIWARVTAGRSFGGRTVELQRSSGRVWTTIERATLGLRSAAVFPAPTGGTATLRVAMSVNAAGRGFLGAASDAFRYRGRPLSVSALASASSIVFGRPLVLSGRVSSMKSGQRVTVIARSYGSSTVHRVRVVSRAGGYWSAQVAPSIQTTYEANWDGITSAAVGVTVHPAVSVVVLSGWRLRASVLPGGVFVGRRVELQHTTSGGWKTITQLRLVGSHGQAVFTIPTPYRGALLRVAMSVNEAGAGYLGSTSRAFAEEQGSMSLASSSLKVLYGHRLRLAGSVSSRKSGQIVSVVARPYGASRVTRVATLRTGAGGRWSARVAPSIQTTYSARWGNVASRALVVGVEPLVTVKMLSHGRIAAHVGSGRSLRGRLVQLQRLTAARRWTTIERKPLDRRASAIFSPPPDSSRTSIMRVALSVNQAGDGLLGAASHPFAYHHRLEASASSTANCSNVAATLIGLCLG